MYGKEVENIKKSLLEIKETGKVSIPHLQRRCQIGYNQASRIIDFMIARGVLSDNRPKPYDINSEKLNALLAEIERGEE